MVIVFDRKSQEMNKKYVKFCHISVWQTDRNDMLQAI